MKTEGYAIMSRGVIDVRTVSDTARAAKVNWLYNVGYHIYANTPDEAIEQWFLESAEATGVELIKVNIEKAD
jgi:hypothetical protein